MPSPLLNTDAGQIALERHRLGEISLVADDRAARANRYELALHNLENVTPQALCMQVIEALNTTDSGFDLFLHETVKRRDEKLLGKLILRLLDQHRHGLAEDSAE